MGKRIQVYFCIVFNIYTRIKILHYLITKIPYTNLLPLTIQINTAIVELSSTTINKRQ